MKYFFGFLIAAAIFGAFYGMNALVEMERKEADERNNAIKPVPVSMCIDACISSMMSNFHSTEKKFLGGAASSSMATSESGIWDNVVGYCEAFYQELGCYEGGYKAVREIHDSKTFGYIGIKK